MLKLPHWCITDLRPAFYDTESKSTIEMVARVYGKMNELIDSYNTWIDKINADIEAFENSTDKNIEEFAIGLRQEFQDFIDTVELKLMNQDKEIKDAVNFMKTNLNNSVTSLLKEIRENGELTEDILNAFNDLNVRMDTFTKSNIPFNKEYYNQLYIDVCRIENGVFRNEVHNISDIKKDILYAVNTGSNNFCVMIEMCMHDGVYYRPLTNAILAEIMDYADSLNAKIGFIKIHENTPIETITNNYGVWLNNYNQEIKSLYEICQNHNVTHFTVMNEKTDVYNNDLYYSDIIATMIDVKSHGFKTGVTSNGFVRTEVLNVANYDYQNVYPRVAYNANLQNEDVYDVMLKNMMIVLADRKNDNVDKSFFISEIGCKPYVEYLAFPAKYSPENYWTFSDHAFRQYFFNVFKVIQNIDVVGFCDFYNHGHLESGYIGNVRDYWMKGDVNNVIL